LQTLADVHEAREEWPKLLRVTTTLLDRLNVSAQSRETELLLQRAHARVELGDLAGAEDDLSWLRDEPQKWIQRRVKQLHNQIEAQKR
jgi:regulator of sirC expression with transglutaminase-like and TPR domain